MQLKSALLSLFLLGSTAVNAQNSAPNLTSVLSSNSQLTSLTALILSNPDFAETVLNWPYNITILAPDNEAFEEFTKRNSTSQDSVPNNENSTDVISSLLRFHILNGTYYARDFVEGKTGVAWSLLANNSFANLNNNQSQVVFGRRDDGNDDDDISFYSGLGREADVERANIEFDKGVIHIIDEVLTLPSSTSGTIVGLRHTAAAGGLVRAGMVDAVDTTPSLTLFVPNNAAFQAIGNLLDNLDNEELANIIQYHATNQTIYDLTEAENEDLVFTSLEGGVLTIHQIQGRYFVNGARIIGDAEGGVITQNGVIYVIDSVLNPANGDTTTTYTPNPTASTQPPAFSSATYVSDVPFTTELVDGTGTPTSTETNDPTTTDDNSGSGSLKEMPVSFMGLAVPLFMAGLGGFFML